MHVSSSMFFEHVLLRPFVFLEKHCQVCGGRKDGSCRPAVRCKLGNLWELLKRKDCEDMSKA